jgi:hypothetical protein
MLNKAIISKAIKEVKKISFDSYLENIVILVKSCGMSTC